MNSKRSFLTTSRLGIALAGALAVLPLAATLVPATSEACGCFAPPNPAVPVVQAGERILFAYGNGEVIAHIQIQYQGKPDSFGWLLPLPSVPKKKDGSPGIDLGVDELFTTLTSQTQPRYQLRRVYETCGSGLSRNAGLNAAFDSADAGAAPPMASPGDPGPLVLKDTVGPFAYAVLKADSKTEMFNWLSREGYIVPAGTEATVGPYIRPGGYFLALKLKPGLEAGDLQPVVLRYQSDLPMIPIILTSVAATPNMGIQVWMLGNGRAIPRNFYHTVVNDAQIDWLNAGRNYNDVIIKAVGEADGKHSFVTEYAGSSSIMRGLLDRPGRFDGLGTLSRITDPVTFIQQANSMFSATGTYPTIAGRYIPLPAALAAQGVTPSQFYSRISFYLGQDRAQNPGKYTDIEAKLADFPNKAAAFADELRTTIAEPTVDAGGLFSAHGYLTRLYTTLSPADMNTDPSFSYNPSLPEYPKDHSATLTYHCSGFFSGSKYSDATLETPSGFRRNFSIDEVNNNTWTPVDAPYSQQIQALRETGGPEVLVDNTDAIKHALGGSGCSSTLAHQAVPSAASSATLALLLGTTAAALFRRRRRGPQA